MAEIIPRRDAQLQSDAEKARTFAQQSRSKNTKRAYRSDWRDFVAWCESRGLYALPAAPETVALYVSSRASELKISTLERRLAAISQAHKTAGYESPASTSQEPLHTVWSGIVRQKTRRRKKAAPVLIEDLRAILEALPHEDPEDSSSELGFR